MSWATKSSTDVCTLSGLLPLKPGSCSRSLVFPPYSAGSHSVPEGSKEAELLERSHPPAPLSWNRLLSWLL